MLRSPSISRATLALLIGALCSLGSPSVAAAQSAAVAPAAALAPAAAGVPSAPASAQLARALDVEAATVQTLVLPAEAGEPFVVDVQIDGHPERLQLWPHSVRAEGFRLQVQTAAGLADAPAPAPATYRGVVRGLPGSLVAASLRAGALTATVRLARDQPAVGIQPAAPHDSTAGPADHAVFSRRDLLAGPWSCGVLDSLRLGDPGAETPGAGGGGTSGADGSAPSVTEIGCDSDVQFYELNGSSVAATEADIESIVNAVAAIYEADVGLTYTITTIIVRTVEPDPYDTSTPSSLLNKLEDHWIHAQSGVPRDAAHLFTGRNLAGSVIGIAELGTMCNAYGLSESKFSGNFTNRTALTAHELGHNWGASHCNGQGTCQIMCSAVAACGTVTAFGWSATNAILNKKLVVPCLDVPAPTTPPTLASLSPTSVSALPGEAVTLLGGDFSQTTSVTVGGVVLAPTSGFNVLTNGAIQIATPTAQALGAVDVTVENAAGSSNALQLTYEAADPPLLAGNFAAFTIAPYVWTYAGSPGATAYLVLALDTATFPFGGFEILLNITILHIDTLDAAGVGSISVPIPASAIGVQFHTQVATLAPTFEGASNIISTSVFF